MHNHTTAKGRRVLSGTIEKLDFARRQISLRVGHEVTTLRSRKPLNLPGIRLGDTIHVALDEDGAVSFGKPRAQHPITVNNVFTTVQSAHERR